MAGLYSYKGKSPKIHKDVFLAPEAVVVGDVEIGEGSSIWFNAVVRGDVSPVRIGKNTNIQDNATIHVMNNNVTEIGDSVLIGHIYLSERKIFIERKGIDILYKVSPAKSSRYLTAEHLGVATSNIDPVSGISEPPCKSLPTFYILYFVKKEYRPVSIHLFITRLYQVEFRHVENINTVILKIKIQDFLYRMPRSKQTVYMLIHQVRLASPSQSDKNIIGRRLQFVLSHLKSYSTNKILIVAYQIL